MKINNKFVLVFLVIALLVTACGTPTSPAPTGTPKVAKISFTLRCDQACTVYVQNNGNKIGEYRVVASIEEPGMPALELPKLEPKVQPTRNVLNDRYAVAYGWTPTPTALPTPAVERRNFRNFIIQFAESRTRINPGETLLHWFSYSFKPNLKGQFLIRVSVYQKNAQDNGEFELEPQYGILGVSEPDIKMTEARSLSCDTSSVTVHIDSAGNSLPWNSVYRDNEKFLLFENKTPSSIKFMWPLSDGAKVIESSWDDFTNHQQRIYCLPPQVNYEK